jgi:FADH2 O2-dependent halogenase
MMYFAAASYSETALRLGKADRAPGFLLRGHVGFNRSLQHLCREARRKTLAETEFHLEVGRAIEPINVAGLCDPAKRNWYPVDLADLHTHRHKVDANSEEIEAMLRRCGIA